ncbi:disco-interacting protein 2 homolog C-like isoform X20 [Macaca fascicularis]|uniref:disco-interacting protein 2 homolog C-like isoform X19 n=1 Tax=Macaca fascicularis TaxID=9541 RepID=UPI003D15B8C5
MVGPVLDSSFQKYVHTEAVQAALAKHKEWKMAVPMPSKRRSLVVQTSMDAYTPPVGRPTVIKKVLTREKNWRLE